MDLCNGAEHLGELYEQGYRGGMYDHTLAEDIDLTMGKVRSLVSATKELEKDMERLRERVVGKRARPDNPSKGLEPRPWRQKASSSSAAPEVIAVDDEEQQGEDQEPKTFKIQASEKARPDLQNRVLGGGGLSGGSSLRVCPDSEKGRCHF